MNNLAKALIVAGVLAGLFIGALVVLNTGPEDDQGASSTAKNKVAPVDPVDQNVSTKKMDTPIDVNRSDVPGRATKSGGGPLPGVAISVFVLEGTVHTKDPVAQATSDARGEFTLAGLKPGKYRVRGRRKGFQEQRIDFTVIENAAPDTLLMEFEAGLAISGHLRSALDNSPIEGGRVVAQAEFFRKDQDFIERLKGLTQYKDMQVAPSFSATTDSEGWYQIVGLEPREYRLEALASGYAPETMKYVEAPTDTADFTLQQGGQLTGTVTGAGYGPVAGAVIKVYRQAPQGQVDIVEEVVRRLRPPLAERTTDSSGRYAFDDLGGGQNFRLNISAPRFQMTPLENVVVEPGDQVEMDVELQPGLIIAGVVLDPNGRPLPGSKVRANAQGGRARGQADLGDDGIMTDENGEFVFDTLEDAQYRIVASHDQYASFQQNRVKAGTEDLNIQLTLGGAIGGSIVDSSTDEGIPGAVLTIRDIGGVEKSAVSRDDGTFEVGGLTQQPKGAKTTITVEAEGFARSGTTTVVVTEGEITEGVIITLDRHAMVSGLVQDASGKPIAGCSVVVKRQHSPSVPVIINVSGTVLTDASGRFQIKDASPGEACFLSGTHPDYLETEGDAFDVLPGETVDGQALAMRIGGSIRGVVVDDAGNALEGVIVAVRDDHLGTIGAAAMKDQARTEANGEFTIRRVEEGTHTLLAELDGYLSAELTGVDVSEGLTTETPQIQLTQGSYVSGFVMDSYNEPLRGAKITVVDTSQGMQKLTGSTDSNGYFRIDDLGPYEVRIDAELQGYTRESQHNVPVNNENVQFNLMKLGSIQGMVFNQNNEPLRAFSVGPKIVIDGRELPKKATKTFNRGDGSYHYEGLEPGTYNVSFFAPGFAGKTLENVIVEQDRVTQLGDVFLEEGGKLGGTVIDASTGEPIRGAQVRVIGGGRRAFVNGGPGGNRAGRGRNRQGSAVTDPNGYFLIEGLAVPEVTVKIDHRNFISTTLTKVKVDNVDMEIALEAGGTLSGVITMADGSTQRGVGVLVSGPQNFSDRKVTDGKGNYRFNSLPPGNYTIRVTQLFVESKERVDIKNIPTYEVKVTAGQVTTRDIRLRD